MSILVTSSLSNMIGEKVIWRYVPPRCPFCLSPKIKGMNGKERDVIYDCYLSLVVYAIRNGNTRLTANKAIYGDAFELNVTETCWNFPTGIDLHTYSDFGRIWIEKETDYEIEN